MNPLTIDDQFVKLVCKDNPDIMRFLGIWHKYANLIDDIVDGDKQLLEGNMQVFSLANELYSCPFYIHHKDKLGMLVQHITCMYEDSVEFERTNVPWKKMTADVIRHGSTDMFRAVAYIVGGYSHMRKISPVLHELCYMRQHTADGRAT